MAKPFNRIKFSDDPLEDMAYHLGQLLKAYAGDPGSATDFMALAHAFQAGFNADRQVLAEVNLPMIPRREQDLLWDGHCPLHDPAAKDVLVVSVGADFLDVTTKRIEQAHDMYGLNLDLPKGAQLAVDHNGRLSLTVRNEPKKERKEFIGG